MKHLVITCSDKSQLALPANWLAMKLIKYLHRQRAQNLMSIYDLDWKEAYAAAQEQKLDIEGSNLVMYSYLLSWEEVKDKAVWLTKDHLIANLDHELQTASRGWRTIEREQLPARP